MVGESIFDRIKNYKPGSIDPTQTFVPDPASQETDALVGSPGKIEVIKRRLESGQELWHPDDNTIADIDYPEGTPTALISLERRENRKRREMSNDSRQTH